VVFLLNTLGYWSLERIWRFWPALLILIGVYMLYVRLADRSEESTLPPPLSPGSSGHSPGGGGENISVEE
jgi:hypothetical protein